jgi:hypothetical protein
VERQRRAIGKRLPIRPDHRRLLEKFFVRS